MALISEQLCECMMQTVAVKSCGDVDGTGKH